MPIRSHPVNQGGTPVRYLFTKTLTVMVLVAFCSLTVVPAGQAQVSSSEDTENTGTQAGLGAASVLVTLPYSATKFAFAVLGGVFGGFTYVFSGGNLQAANAVWDTSMRGTFVITPRHLKGEEPIRFLGIPSAHDQVPAPAP